MTALHGFLGRPEDWDGILGEAWTRPSWLARGRPVCSRRADAPSAYLDALAMGLNQKAVGDVLLGYSMGGRIALHMLLSEPGRWRRAVIVSASPGLIEPRGDQGGTNMEREARLERDLGWADRFLHDGWDAVVRDWNAQAVFSHDPPDRLPRRETDYDREALAEALALGSVARQRDLRPELAALSVPVIWIAGAKDPKYAALAQECAALNPLFTAKILDAGHRVPWGDPDGFRSAVERFTTITP